MMAFFKRLLLSDIEPSTDERSEIAASKREVEQTRGEYRQTVQRLEANIRVMQTWSHANRMVK